jgi:hypothetical protein
MSSLHLPVSIIIVNSQYIFNVYYCNFIVKYLSEFSFGTYRPKIIYTLH